MARSFFLPRLLSCSALAVGLSLGTAPAKADVRPIEVRVVVVTAFEIGKDTGDVAGELQNWAAAMPGTLPFPAGERALRYDVKRGVLVLNTGIGTNRAATSVMALATDPRFDMRHAYWLVAAIAGVNPDTGSVGSAAWIGDIVDTDHGYAIDPREIPSDWTTGIFPQDKSSPYEAPRGETKYNLFPLNKGLRDWAYALTARMSLPDTPVLAHLRAGYTHYPAAQCLPTVMTGDEATGQTFWHGKYYNDHVEKWTAYWTGRQGSFVMTAMEDSGVAHALDVLQALGKADAKRLMVLRTGSNYSIQPEGKSAAQSLSAEAMQLSGLGPSVDAAYTVGSRVVNELADHWPRYRMTIPAGPAAPAAPSLSCSAQRP